MRFDGTLAKWNAECGFGFIAPTQGGQEIFIHISSFPKDGQPPRLNEALSFEVDLNKDGKKRAIRVSRPVVVGHFSTVVQPTMQKYAEPRRQRRAQGWRVRSLVSVILVALGAYAYQQYDRRRMPVLPPTPLVSPAKDPFAPATYRCDGRTFCSQMTSCAEATFFLKTCPGTKMDGNHDGVPCEKQWCQ